MDALSAKEGEKTVSSRGDGSEEVGELEKEEEDERRTLKYGRTSLWERDLLGGRFDVVSDSEEESTEHDSNPQDQLGSIDDRSHDVERLMENL